MPFARAVAADGLATVVTSAVGGSPTTTYAENIGVMAATKVYSTAAYYIAGLIAIAFGLVPKFGALVSATPAGVLHLADSVRPGNRPPVRTACLSRARRRRCRSRSSSPAWPSLPASAC